MLKLIAPLLILFSISYEVHKYNDQYDDCCRASEKEEGEEG